MEPYLKIVKTILKHGVNKSPGRVQEDGTIKQLENDTIGIPNTTFEHYMDFGFPLLTTKKMSLKTIAIELEGFIKGITDKNWYKNQKCNIWNEWCNPAGLQKDIDKIECATPGPPGMHSLNETQIKELQKVNSDLGPIYGYQWRRFGQEYNNDQLNNNDRTEKEPSISPFDQLNSVVEKLRDIKKHGDRRMVVSAWNPNQLHQMALPACHLMYQVVVYGETINLWWSQRSCDVGLGLPYNIASYALLLKLLGKEAGLRPHKLSAMIGDCHIYDNHKEQLTEQSKRIPNKLPTVKIPDENWNGIFNWTAKDLILENYEHHDRVKMEVTV